MSLEAASHAITTALAILLACCFVRDDGNGNLTAVQDPLGNPKWWEEQRRIQESVVRELPQVSDERARS